MMFVGEQLRELVERTSNEIELRRSDGRCYRTLSPGEALALDLDLFVGVGNARRIKFLRQRTQLFALNAGSRTTRRIKNEDGINITHPIIREHRPSAPPVGGRLADLGREVKLSSGSHTSATAAMVETHRLDNDEEFPFSVIAYSEISARSLEIIEKLVLK